MKKFFVPAVITAFVSHCGFVQAATWIRTATGSQLWDTASNWSGGIPNGINAVAEFKSPGAWNSALTVSRSGSIILGTLNVVFANNGNLSLSTSSSADFIFQRSSGTATITTTEASGGAGMTVTGRNIVLNSNLTIDSPSFIRLSAFNTTNGGGLNGSGTLLKKGLGALDLNVIRANSWTGDLNLQGGSVSCAASTGPVSGTVFYHNTSGASLAGNWGTRQINLINSGTDSYKLSGRFNGNLSGSAIEQDIELNGIIGGDNSGLSFASTLRRVVVPVGQALTIASANALGASNALPLRLGSGSFLYIGDETAPLPLTITGDIEITGGANQVEIFARSATNTHHVISGDVVLNHNGHANPAVTQFRGAGGNNRLEISGQIRDAGAGGDVSTIGNVVFSGANSYKGNTTVSGGVLTVNHDDVFDDSSTVTIPGVANLNLTHDGIDTVGGLVIGGISRPNGTYIFGSGRLQVGPPIATPRISILGNAVSISPGDLTPDAHDHTDFGNVVIDQATLQRTFTIENTGSADLLLDDPDPVTVSGSAASDFVVIQPAVTILPPGGSTTFSVIFDPVTVGLRSATISVSSDDPDNDPFTFAIQGMGVVPTVFTWSGLGANDHWSTPGNWVGGMAPPQDGSAWVVFPDTPRNSPMIDTPWHVYGIRFEGVDFSIKTFSGESLQIGGGGVVEASATVSLAFFNLPVMLSSDQSWRLEGSNPSLPQIGGGWVIDTNGKQLTIENGSSWGAQFEGGISGAGSLVLDAGGSLSLEGPLSLTGGIWVHENADLTVYDISYSGAIHGVNASFLRFQGIASGPLLPVVTGHFFQIQYIGGSPMRTLELLNPSTSVASYSSGVYGIRLKLGDDAAFGLSHSFSLGGVTGEDATLEAIGGARVLSQRLYRQYASSLVIAGENPITFEGGANFGGYAGETPYIDVREPSGLLRIHGVGFGNHAYPMEKRGAGTLELGGDGNNDFRFPLHVSGGRLLLNKATQPGGLHAFAGDLRIGDGSGSDELILLNSNQIADTSKVHLEANGIFDLGGKQETIGMLEGAGTVGNSSSLANSILTVAVPAGQTSTFSGTLVDSLAEGSRTLGLKKAGQGSMILTGSSSNSSLQVESGLLQVDGLVGSSSSTVFVTGQGTLCGSGELAGLVTVAGSGGGATLAPGPGVTTLKIGGGVEVYPGAQRFEFEIDGISGIADRLRVDDFIQLGAGNAALVVTDIQPAGSPSGPVVLIENTSLQPTEGYFSGLPEGAQVSVGAHFYTITYEGGIGGNDVVLLPPAPPQPAIQLELPEGGVLSEFAMLDFGSQLGNPEFSIAEFYHDRTILIRNTGNAPLTVNWVDVAPDPMSWRYHFQPLNAPYAESIPVDGMREVIVRFQPIQGTSSYLTGQLRISSNDPATPTRYVMLTGSVIQPVSLLEAMQTAGLVGDDALPSATPFGDGVENLLKYAFNMNLAGPDSSRMEPGTGTSGLPSVMLAESSGEPVLRVEFVRRRGSGLVYTPKFSTGLSGFQPMTANEVVTPIDAQWERVTVEQPQDQATADRGFAVVEVIAP